MSDCISLVMLQPNHTERDLMPEINIVENYENRQFSSISTNKGVVLCDKKEGAFIVIRSTQDLLNLKALLDKFETIE